MRIWGLKLHWLVGWLIGITGAAQFVASESGDVVRESDSRLWYF